MLDDRDLLDMFPVRVKQCETILDGQDKAAAGAQADRTDRLAHSGDLVAACHRVEPVHSPMWDVQPQQPLLPAGHTGPLPIAA